MPCYSPIVGYRSKQLTKNGKRKVVFNTQEGFKDRTVELPCGQCIGCRLERSRAWAMRLMHEASLHEESCFLTLTYDEEHLPADGSLNKRHHQLFMKRLRKSVPGKTIKFYHVGEYGDRFRRPHYHTILFGHEFTDIYQFGESNGVPYFRSPELERLWPHGNAMVGAVTFESAAYVARYCLKKVTGQEQDQHYEIIDHWGEVHKIQPEYATMSRGGRTGRGIAADWFDAYRKDLNKDFVTVCRGVKCKLPKYYDKLLEQESPHDYQQRKEQRHREAKKNKDNAPHRLEARRKVQLAKLDFLPRIYENDQ